ncbi:cutinase family protein [Nocardia sp. GAS34]|uniref:cutinase family protein n=1 Tax=unclassified Nocardia TaxID=2637762 RepID=UPI003D1D869F
MTVVAAAAVTVAAAGTAAAPVVHAQVPMSRTCPALYVLAAQGPDQASPDTGADVDTGVLGTMLRPLLDQASGLVERAYVPYDQVTTTTTGSNTTTGIDLGAGTTSQNDSYSQSIAATLQRADTMATGVLTECPKTLIAAAGYTEGAQVMAEFAQQAASGSGPVPADHIAGVALFGDPARPASTPVFPGRAGQTTPTPAPGTTGTAVSKVSFLNPALPGAGGIGLPANSAATDSGPAEASDYGPLDGRVVQLCTPGDITCDKPAHGALLNVFADIGKQADFHDPITAVTSIANALSATVINTGVNVINNDISGTSLDSLAYQPQESISQRLADASNPHAPQPGPNDAISALFKLGTIAFNTAVAVAADVFTPDTLAALATVGLANPAAALGILGTKLAGALVQVVSPQLPGLVNEAFTAIQDNVKDNSDLVDLDLDAQYSSAVGNQNTYGTVPVTSTGQPPLAATTTWFTALAKDIAATGVNFGTPTQTTGTAPATDTTSPATTDTSAPQTTIAATPTP